ncbi:MAG: TIGR01459 family HAD-type hydrolase [Rhizobiales bacterium]|nr:TIGR01459 family HAD-type hydrolase [Hyphomicrobiales bacterium]
MSSPAAAISRRRASCAPISQPTGSVPAPPPDRPTMDDLSRRYPLWLCDVWGVVHNGQRSFPAAVAALRRHRANGGHVVLVTNAPRLSGEVRKQLDRLGVDQAAYDAVVTSGEVTRHLVARHAGKPIYHIGPPNDVSVMAGIDVVHGSIEDASVIVCVGLRDDRRDSLGDYEPLLDELRARDLEMICANPDKVVRVGDRLIYCAGALAERYAKKGGRVSMAGKPYAPIFDLAVSEASRLAGRQFARRDILMIGDGPETDVKGAADYGIACLFITGGIMLGDDSADAAQAHAQGASPHARIVASMPRLSW